MGTPLVLCVVLAWCAARGAIRARTGVGVYDGWKLVLAPLDVALGFAAAQAAPDPAVGRCVTLVAIGLAMPWRPLGRIPPSAVVLAAVLAAGLVREGVRPMGELAAEAALMLVAWGISRVHVRRTARIRAERDLALERIERLDAARVARTRHAGEGAAPAEPAPTEAASDLFAVLRASRARAGEQLARERGAAVGHARDLELIVHASPGAPRELPLVDRAALDAAFDGVFRLALERSSGERLLKVLVGGDATRPRVRFIHDLVSAPVAMGSGVRCRLCGVPATEVVLADPVCAGCVAKVVRTELVDASVMAGPLEGLVSRHGVRIAAGFQNRETREVFVELVFGDDVARA